MSPLPQSTPPLSFPALATSAPANASKSFSAGNVRLTLAPTCSELVMPARVPTTRARGPRFAARSRSLAATLAFTSTLLSGRTLTAVMSLNGAAKTARALAS